MLEARTISVRYGPCDVLREVSLSLGEGRLFALLGPNGAGKTTLLKALNGTLRADKGSVLLDGRPLSELSRPEAARRVAVVAQENETKFPVTVLDFVLSGRFAHGGAFGWERAEDIAVAERALAECDLHDYATRLMNQLSGGERQRVVLARALATEAKILLLDEPTANLDLAHQAMIFRLVRGRCDAEGFAAVVITHDLNLAAEFADELVLLHRGGLFAAGTAEEVLSEANIAEVFGVRSLRDRNPATGKVRITPIF